MASPDEMRASDADRSLVGDRLRAALDEGRLDFHEYDTRLKDAYAAKTYGELQRLLDDLPVAGVAPPASSQVVPVTPAAVAPSAVVPGAEPAPTPGQVTRAWLWRVWIHYVVAVSISTGIWLAVAVLAGELLYFWPIWVAGPWGVVLLVQTVAGLARGEPQRQAAKRERKRRKRAAKIERRTRGQNTLSELQDGA